MIMHDFDYYRPDTLKEASTLLSQHNNSMVLAGGTDLLVKMRGGKHRPDRVVDVKAIDGLDCICWREGDLFIGANVTWTQLKNDETVKTHFPALHQSCRRFGCFEIRNRATLGGNVCSASPGCESGGPLVVYEALVEIYGPTGIRREPVVTFITGPGRTSLKSGELVSGVLIPRTLPKTRSAYRRIARVQGQDLATCAVTVLAVNPDDPKTRQVRVGMSAVFKNSGPFTGIRRDTFFEGD